MSLEVAEHLAENRAEDFVGALCSASDVVLFAAAIRHQGGRNHVNEQWQSYWIERFASNDCRCFDIFRASLWNDRSVEWWYRQNIFLFCRPGTTLIGLQQLTAAVRPVTNIVHPLNYESRINDSQNPGFRDCLVYFGRFLSRAIRRLFRGPARS